MGIYGNPVLNQPRLNGMTQIKPFSSDPGDDDLWNTYIHIWQHMKTYEHIIWVRPLGNSDDDTWHAGVFLQNQTDPYEARFTSGGEVGSMARGLRNDMADLGWLCSMKSPNQMKVSGCCFMGNHRAKWRIFQQTMFDYQRVEVLMIHYTMDDDPITHINHY